MKVGLKVQLGQRLALTPRLQQSIRLLLLSNLELRAEIQQALESNIMLEEAEAGGTEENSDTARDESQERAAGEERDAAPEAEAGEAAALPEDIPAELPMDSDWGEIYDGPARPAGSGDRALEPPEALGTERQTLHDCLERQLNLLPLDPTERALAAAIVGAIDERGYLTTGLEELRDALGKDARLESLERILAKIQEFEPPGVGARGLQECLLLQLGQLPPDTPWRQQASRLVADYFDLLAAADFAAIGKALGLQAEQLQEAVALIRSLDPHPGTQSQEADIRHVTPDLIAKKDRGRWKVEYNAGAAPKLRVNRLYQELARNGCNGKDRRSLKTHLQEARWLIKSLRTRADILRRIAACIVERQQGFLEHGESAMRPMVLNDIAEELSLNESTVSRATTEKYILTPRGMYELKYFFSSSLGKGQDSRSSTAVKAVLKEIVAGEPPGSHLSDRRLAELLAQRGIRVARRTVAKYRESLGISDCRGRKKIAKVAQAAQAAKPERRAQRPAPRNPA